ncbi:thioredoxin-disulfide reductase [Chloroflexota bacterium]
MNKEYELIVVGGGPAGLAAGIYASRARLKSLLIEQGLFGGQIVDAEVVENFPGFPEGISGFDLSKLMHQQATQYGLETLQARVTNIELQKKQKRVRTTQDTFLTKAVIIAGGSERLKLGVPGEKEFTGKGVSYCATCDATFFTDLPIAVVGGSDTAITEALHLAKFASRVTVIHRRHQLRASRILQERAFAETRIEFLWDSVVDIIEGENMVKRLKLHNVKTEETFTLKVTGVFISIGVKPNNGYFKDILPLDSSGHIITNDRMETRIAGILAAGDIRHDSARQAITAAGDGATAAIYAEEYLNEERA